MVHESENVVMKAVSIELNQCIKPCVYCFYFTYGMENV